jgi:Fungal mating-type pheromone
MEGDVHPSGEGNVPDPVSDMADIGERAGGALNLKGCAPILIVAVVLIVIVIGVLKATDDDKPSSATESPSASASESASPSETSSASPSPSPEPSESPSASEDESEDPSAETERFSGTSGGQIGCITCDGQSRYLHLEHPGVGVGDAARPGMEVVWPRNGKFVEFGADISGPNQGRYGFALFANGTSYYAGCTMEIGQTSCSAAAKTKVKKGDRITIIIGEGGTMNGTQPASRGEFVVNWYFLFQPAASAG